MIRRMQRADIDRVADIWLDTNIRAHCAATGRVAAQNRSDENIIFFFFIIS